MDIKSNDINGVLTLCNSFKLATVCLSLDMYITQVNPVAELLFLHPKHQLINKTIHEICRELGVDAPIAPTATPETLEQISLPTSHWLSNEKLVNVHWSISCCLDDDGYTGYVLVGKVILACSANQPLVQIENIIKSLPCFIFSKNIDGQYLFSNKYQWEASGFSNEKEILGKTDYDTTWFAEADLARQADALTIAENSTIVIEEYGTMANGIKEQFLMTKSPLKDQNGNVLGVCGTGVNIAYKRQTFFSNDYSNSLVLKNKNSSQIYLSKKEIECVNWMIKGKSSSEIASILGNSTRTVEAHMNNIKRKLNCYKQFQVGYLVGKYGYLLL